MVWNICSFLGHTSLHGVLSVTSVDSAKVLDISIQSKFCHTCAKGKGTPHNCQSQYVGSSGGMESAGAVEVFQRSIESRGVRYTHYIGDGDSKAFQTVNEKKIYDVPIEKLECVGHVRKRMGKLHEESIPF